MPCLCIGCAAHMPRCPMLSQTLRGTHPAINWGWGQTQYRWYLHCVMKRIFWVYCNLQREDYGRRGETRRPEIGKEKWGEMEGWERSWERKWQTFGEEIEGRAAQRGGRREKNRGIHKTETEKECKITCTFLICSVRSLWHSTPYLLHDHSFCSSTLMGNLAHK